MKTVGKLKSVIIFPFLFFLVVGLHSCKDDEPGDVIILPIGSIAAEEEQVISQNTLLVDQVMANSAVWLVARHTNSEGDIIDRILLTDETTANIDISIDEMTEVGDVIYLMLYIDDVVGEGDGKFEEDGDDMPIPGATEAVIVLSPAFSITDPTITNNALTFDNVTTATSGWIVVYNADPDSETAEVIGSTFVTESENNVVVNLKEEFTYTSGQEIFARLHLDDPEDESFTYETDPTHDIPEIFGFEPENTITQTIVLP